MFVVIIVSLLAILFTHLESQGRLKNGMAIGFVLVTIIAAIHYDYGNDYMEYYRRYKTVSSTPFNLSEIFEDTVLLQPGWILINYLFTYFGGFFAMVAVLNIIQNYIYYRLIKDNVPSNLRVVSVAIYLCSSAFYLLNFSMMRQGLVVAIFASLWPWIMNKKVIRVLICLFLSSFIHKTALVLLPFAFWGFVPVNKGKILSVIYVVLFFLLMTNTDLINSIMDKYMAVESFENYADYYGEFDNQRKYGLGFILGIIPFIISLYYINKNKRADRNSLLIVSLSCVGAFINPFADVIQMAGRLGAYFSVFTIVALPLTYNAIPNDFIRKIAYFFWLVLLLYSYYMFFTNSVYAPYYKEFNTIFSQL